MHYIALYCTVLYCYNSMVLYCTVANSWYCTVLYLVCPDEDPLPAGPAELVADGPHVGPEGSALLRDPKLTKYFY